MSDIPEEWPGYIVEGEVKSREDDNGDKVWYIDAPEQVIPIDAIIKHYEGDEVRLTLAGIDELKELIEQHGDDWDDEQTDEDS